MQNDGDFVHVILLCLHLPYVITTKCSEVEVFALLRHTAVEAGRWLPTFRTTYPVKGQAFQEEWTAWSSKSQNSSDVTDIIYFPNGFRRLETAGLWFCLRLRKLLLLYSKVATR